jgi:hypothetical protein
VDLYIHSPICLNDEMLNKLSTGTTLPFLRAESVPPAYGFEAVSLRRTKINTRRPIPLKLAAALPCSSGSRFILQG